MLVETKSGATKLNRAEQVMLYVIKTLNDLVDAGILKGSPFEVNPKALRHLDGFEPTDEEIDGAIAVLDARGFLKHSG